MLMLQNALGGIMAILREDGRRDAGDANMQSLQKNILSRSAFFVNGNARQLGRRRAVSPEEVQAVRMKRFMSSA